ATSRSPESVPDGARFLTIDELVATSDIVVLCCPLTPETTGLLNAGRIGLMKPAAILVNVSRGPVIDDAALIEALRDGRAA
ncbi:NAD(P)-dependent oxidoreductase, partial [Rhizobium leguminosarum]|uniref:NAD(P)-dependent oxidoreductase n=1 Tax=Rhizobium leguminosarum TaxID=384 RepID=UPI003F963319